MNLKEWVDWGVTNGYLFKGEEKFRVTIKLSKEYESNVIDGGSGSVPATTNKQVSRQPTFGNIEELYKQYQVDSLVPFRIKTNDGKEFTVRTKSKGALLKLMSILTRGVNYQALVLATRFYYGNPNLFKKPLAKFLEEDIWESYYDEIMTKADEGILEKHVKDVINPASKFGRDL